MFNKLFFMSVFLLTIGGIGFLAAFSLNALPQPVEAFVYGLLAAAPQGPSAPYLQKFEGHWAATLVPDEQWSAVERCPDDSGTLAVHNGAFSGSFGVASISVTGHVDETGALQASFAAGGQDTGSISGSLSGAAGSGSWKDSLDCAGTITFTKLDPVVDPQVATISSFTYDVVLERGGAMETPTPGEALYQGDVLAVPAGATAHLQVGSGFTAEPMDLTGSTTYTVPAPQ